MDHQAKRGTVQAVPRFFVPFLYFLGTQLKNLPLNKFTFYHMKPNINSKLQHLIYGKNYGKFIYIIIY